MSAPVHPRGACALFVSLLWVVAACGGQPLVVDAGPDQTVQLGAAVALAPTLPSGGPWELLWSFEARPAGSAATLEAPTTAEAGFTPDMAGPYVLKLVARGGGREGSDTLIVTAFPNQQPIADAGDDRVVAVGSVVELDGRGSRDPEGKSLTFQWRIDSQPAGSEAALNNPEGRTPLFTADLPGVYAISLTVGDGALEGTTAISIRANRAPIADAGSDRPGTVGHRVELDGSASRDDDGDALTYAWSLISRPGGSSAALDAANEVGAGFVPDVAGDYVVELGVSDGFAGDAVRATIAVVPASGVLGSVVYVAPTGSDANPGTQEAPLATLEAAMDKILAHEALYRIQLAAGAYAERYSVLATDRLLEVVGPATGTAEIALNSGGNVFTVSGAGRLVLSRITFKASTTAALVVIGEEASVSLVDVTCHARTCLQAQSGAGVSVKDSKFLGTTSLEGIGVRVSFGAEAAILDTEIEGFGIGLEIRDATLLVRTSTVLTNGKGLEVRWNASAERSVQVEDCAFDGNGVAVDIGESKGTRLLRTGISPVVTQEGSEGGSGVMVSDSVVQLDGVHAEGLNGENLQVDGASTVTVRRSQLGSSAGPGLTVLGAASIVDLGSATQAGSNVIYGHSGLALFDKRPAGATGLISLAGTKLEGTIPPAGTYTGTTFVHGIRIVAAGNKVTAY